jgi:drug/metabolite transporter (DMT)-like permease
MNWSHRYVTAFAISILLLAVPVLAAVGAWLWLGEPLAPLQVAGGLVVLVAIAFIVTEQQ